MSDGYVGLLPDSSGKKADASELSVAGNTVERQRIVVADPTAAANLAGVTPTGDIQSDDARAVALLGSLLVQQRLTNLLLCRAFNLDDADLLAAETSL